MSDNDRIVWTPGPGPLTWSAEGAETLKTGMAVPLCPNGDDYGWPRAFGVVGVCFCIAWVIVSFIRVVAR